MSSSVSLSLNAEQGEVLTVDYLLQTNRVYAIPAVEIGSREPITGYLVGPGCWVLFIEGTEAQHENFLDTMYGAGKTFLEAKTRGMWLYGTPGSKFVEPENLVAVTISNL